MNLPVATASGPSTVHGCTVGGREYRILRRRVLTPGPDGILEFVVESPLIARHAQAGQFVMVRTWAQGERIPLTIAAYDRRAGTITLIFQMVGFSTRRMGQLQAGEVLLDVLGPLGTPLPIHRYQQPVVCVGGGVGIAPIWPKVKELFELGNEVITIIGARTKQLLILEDELRRISTVLHVTTDDGSYARQGFVTAVLKEVLEQHQHRVAEVIAVGPLPMMLAVVKEMAGKGFREPYDPAIDYVGSRVPCVVSLNPIMVDGTGMCGGCRVAVWDPQKKRYEARFACVDGPAFDGYAVDFGLLTQRNRQYAAQEQAVNDHA